MKTWMVIALIVVVLGLAAGGASAGAPDPRFLPRPVDPWSVWGHTTPPAVRHPGPRVIVPVPEGVWVPGFWAWDGYAWVWVAPHWARPSRHRW